MVLRQPANIDKKTNPVNLYAKLVGNKYSSKTTWTTFKEFPVNNMFVYSTVIFHERKFHLQVVKDDE